MYFYGQIDSFQDSWTHEKCLEQSWVVVQERERRLKVLWRQSFGKWRNLLYRKRREQILLGTVDAMLRSSMADKWLLSSAPKRK